MNGILASSSTIFLSSICTCNCHLVTLYIHYIQVCVQCHVLILSYSCIYLFVFNTFREIVKEKWQHESLVQKYCCDFVITVQTVRHCQLNLVEPIYDCVYSHKSHNGYYVCGRKNLQTYYHCMARTHICLCIINDDAMRPIIGSNIILFINYLLWRTEIGLTLLQKY